VVVGADRLMSWIVAMLIASSLLAQSAEVDLQSLEQRADAEFSKHDWAAAEKSYLEAVQAAQAAGEPARAGLYYRRIGMSRARIGKVTESLDAYRRGIEVTEASGDADMLLENVHGAALALQRLGLLDESFAMAKRENDLAKNCGHPEHLARALATTAELYYLTGNSRANMKLLNEALAISRTTSDAAGTAILIDNLAEGYAFLGDYDAALKLQTEALAASADALPVDRALRYNNLGEVQARLGQADLAWKSFEKAVEMSAGPDGWRIHTLTLLNAAEMRNKAGQTAASDEAFRQALQIARDAKIPDYESTALRKRSEVLLMRGDVKVASEDAANALKIARQMASPTRTYEALLALGSARASAQPEAARTCFDEALTIAETLRAQSSGEASDLRGAFEQLIPLYQASVRNLIDLRLPAEALQRAEQAKARVLMDILLRGGVNDRAVMTPAEASRQDQLRKRLAAANEAVLTMPTPPASATASLQDAMREYRQFRRELYDHHPDLAVQSADFEPAGAEKLAALLPGANTALLDYFIVPSGVALFVVRQSAGADSKPRVSVHLLDDSQGTLSAEVRGFREQLAKRELGYKIAAQHLFHRLLAPAMDDLRGTTDWIVSPDGALWEIPFEALVDSSGRHLIETRAITLTPSLTAAVEIHERRQPATTGGLQLLALGNPLPSSSPLPDAAKEVAEIGKSYPRGSAIVLTGTSATAAEFRSKAPEARTIHLAAHAGLNNSDPLASFVRLGEGKSTTAKDSDENGMLTAFDIMSMHLRADLVVLSACETALGSTGPGEGMIGMGWALSAAGASSSVLSFWKVDSAASREFMTLFYRHLGGSAGSVSKAAALRRTELEMMQSTAYRHPFYWAAFTLWGDGSR